MSLLSKTGVDILETVSKGLVAQDLFEHLPYTSSHSPIKYFLGQKVSGVDQPLCYRLWRVGAMLRLVGACAGMSPSTLESCVNYLTFIDFFLSTNIDQYFHFLSALSCLEGILGGLLVRSDC